MDIGNNEESGKKGLYCREVVTCDHVGINTLMLRGTRNFFISRSAYVVFEDDLCKILCPNCLLKGSNLQ